MATATIKSRPATVTTKPVVASQPRSIPSEWDLLGITTKTSQAGLRAIQRGFPDEAVEYFATQSHLPQRLVLKVLRLSLPKLRDRETGRLTEEESTRLWRLARIHQRALCLFEGDADQAASWLQTPQWSLGKRPPILWTVTEPGAAKVEELILQLEFGVFP